MLIKIILIIFLGIIFIYFLRNSEKLKVKAWLKIILLLSLIFALISIIYPNILNFFAKVVGVGRGADLLFYLFIVFTIFIIANFFTKLKTLKLRQDKIISRIALIEKAAEEKKTDK